jgi:Outer membrane protein beta-barrel domain
MENDMKRSIYLLFIFLLSTSFIVKAQHELRFGPTVGLNFATFNGKDANQLGNLGSKTGVAIGGFMNFQFAELFALQPELNFTMKGASGSSDGINLTYTANYIELPILLKVYVPLAGNSPVRLNAYAGPSFGINLASSVEAQANGQTENQDEKNNTKSVDIGLVFGGGVVFNIGRGIMDLSLRYSLGLTTIDNSGSNLSVTNGIFSIVAQYGFDIR